MIYYISPQIWAWRRRRVSQIARRVDEMLVLFPFEVDFYRGHGVKVRHVGHPLVDEVPELEHIWSQGTPRDRPFQLALLPGSRRSEIEALLEVMLETVRELGRRLPIFVQLIQAPTIPRPLLDEILVRFPDLAVRVVSEERHQALAESHLALCASGTATLETALVGTPMIVVYRLSPWTFLLGRLLVRLPHISLVNLVLDRGVVPELLQAKANPEGIADQAERLLSDPKAIAEMRSGLGELRSRLGEGGASQRVAEAVAPYLEAQGSP